MAIKFRFIQNYKGLYLRASWREYKPKWIEIAYRLDEYQVDAFAFGALVEISYGQDAIQVVDQV